MKYIMIEVEKPVRRRIPIIFPNDMVHAIVAEAILSKAKTMNWQNAKVVSAGDCSVMDVECSGHSSTLKLSSDSFKDERIINNIDYLHGIMD